MSPSKQLSAIKLNRNSLRMDVLNVFFHEYENFTNGYVLKCNDVFIQQRLELVISESERCWPCCDTAAVGRWSWCRRGSSWSIWRAWCWQRPRRLDPRSTCWPAPDTRPRPSPARQSQPTARACVVSATGSLLALRWISTKFTIPPTHEDNVTIIWSYVQLLLLLIAEASGTSRLKPCHQPCGAHAVPITRSAAPLAPHHPNVTPVRAAPPHPRRGSISDDDDDGDDGWWWYGIVEFNAPLDTVYVIMMMKMMMTLLSVLFNRPVFQDIISG